MGLDTNYEIASRKTPLQPVSHGVNPVQKVGDFGPSRGELEAFERKAREVQEQARVNRFKRWAMLSAVRELLPGERVCECCRRPAVRPGEQLPGSVEIHRSAETRDARFHRLAVCGDVWRCPVCAPYVAAERSKELRRVGQEHMAGTKRKTQLTRRKWLQPFLLKKFRRPGGALLVTLTFRHNRGDKLAELLKRFAAAREDLYRQRAFRALLKSVGYMGDVRTLEVTHGANGWHPHTHDLLFIEQPLAQEGEELERLVEIGGEALTIRVRQPSPLQQFSGEFFKLWRKIAKKHGLEVMREGFKVRATLASSTEEDWDALTGYMQDRHEIDFSGGWDAAREMTGAASKLGRVGGRTPFQLLADFALDGDSEAGRLFQEYAAAFKGRRQLSWSSSLKKKYPAPEPEKTDVEAAEYVPAEYVKWAEIPWGQWKLVLRAGGRVRGELLDLAARDDRAGVAALVAACVDGTLKESVTFRHLLLKKSKLKDVANV